MALRTKKTRLKDVIARTPRRRSRRTTSPDFLKQIRELLNGYADDVDKSDLSTHSKAMYIGHADNFVRWIHGEFTPGSVGTRDRKSLPFKPAPAEPEETNSLQENPVTL
ncbi:MAG TPA: hypothetical protein VN622_11025 [Clostridia bacterium]|nr:hypothetical protein [Clostridia bacterium]